MINKRETVCYEIIQKKSVIFICQIETEVQKQLINFYNVV